MKRLYYLADNIKSVESISNELHHKGISDWNFHIVSKDRDSLIDRHLNVANHFLHERDVIRMAERGGLIGIFAVAMISTGLFVLSANALDVSLLIAIMLVVSALAGAFGVVVGIVYGFNVENEKISRFHDDIDAGKYLIMVDVKKQYAEQIKSLMSEHHKDAIDAGEGETIIRPFQVVA